MILCGTYRAHLKEIMKQGLLNALWNLNRRAVRINLPLPGIACMADSFEQTITIRHTTWHRQNSTQIWRRMPPLWGNLRT